MSGDLKVAVELRADTAQFTAQMQSAAQAQAAFAAQAQSSGTAVASALQSTNTAAQALGGGARAASQAAQALGSASQTASDALAGQAIALMRTVNNLRGVTGSLSAGVIPRLRQLAPLVTGAGLAISGAVGAVALLAKAYINGAREAQAYTQAIVMSGNAAGTTVSQLAGMAHAISQTAGTQGAAAAALAQMAGSGRVAGENLQAFTQVALGLERTVGAPVQQTVGHLSELAKAPLEASVKLNEQYHYLTASVYEQIKALEQQGRTEEAAALAQRTYISEMGRRKDEIVAHLGALERAWNSITGVAKQAWDAMLGIGRAKTPMQQLQEVQQQIAKAAPYNAELAQNAGRGGLAGWLNSREKERSDAQLQALLKQQAALIKTTTLEAQGAAAQAESARLAEAKARWDQEGAQYKSRAVKRDEEIRKAEVEGAALIAKGLETERGLRERIAAIREKYKDPKTAATGATNPEAGALRQDQDYLTRLKAEYEQLLANGGEIEKYTAKQGELVLVKDRLAKGLDSQGKALTAQTRQYLEQRQAVLEETVAQEQSKKAIEDANAARQRAKQAADNWLESMRLGNTDLQIQIDNHGKDKTAIEQSTLARMQEALATGQQIKLGGQLVAVTQDMIGAEQERIDKMQALNAQAWGDTLDKQIAAAREQLVLDQQSIALTGVSSEQRAKIVALKKVELEYTRQINKLTDDLKNKKITQAAYDDTVRKLNETRDIEAAAAVSKAYTEEVTKAADQINQGLTDAFMGAFDSGKSFAKNFRDTLKGMFNNLVLRPVISMIVQPVGGLLSGVVGSFLGGGGSSGGAGGIGNLLGLGNNASSIYTMASGTGGLVNSIGSLAGNFGYGGEFAGLASDLGFYGGSYQEALNASIGLAADATPAAGSAAATLSSVGSALGGAPFGYVAVSLFSNGSSAIGNDSNTAVVAGTAIGAVVGSIFPVIGTAIGAAVGGLIGGVVNAAFGHKLADSGVEGDFGGQTGFEGQSYQFYKGGWFASNKTKHGELDPAVQQGLADQFNAMRAGAAGMAGVLGIGTEAIEGFTAHIKVSLKGLSDEEA
ncbi:MAG: phage tail length tape measure family protein, partial [Burkholderiaceae bacterium]|nr:phage tail length tape measure family protein [Burkholderiaceae bacterium]